MTTSPTTVLAMPDLILHRPLAPLTRALRLERRGGLLAALVVAGAGACLGLAALAGSVGAGAGVVVLALLVGLLRGAAALGGPSLTARATWSALSAAAEGAGVAAVAFAVAAERDGGVPLTVALLLFGGALIAGYARPRVLASASLDAPDGPLGVCAREVRLLAVGIAAALGSPLAGLILAAALAHIAALMHLWRARQVTGGH